MGAVPKNKVTRVERAKRRKGNTPKLKKNLKHSKVAKHKKSLVAQIFRAIGLKLEN
ncbi:MAG: hypothetical protein ABFQ62_02245 [Patescibacteria group bacterium]